MIDDDQQDFDDDDELSLDDTGFDDFDKTTGNTLGDLWKNNPMFKIGVVVAGVIVIAVAASFFGGPKQEAVPSVVPAAPEVSSRPGSEGSSPAYIEALVDENTDRYEDAAANGGSAIPTPIETPSGVLSLSNKRPEDSEDPLQRWRRLQEERLKREREAQLQREKIEATLQTPAAPLNVGPTPEQIAQKNNTVKALAERMVQQMQAILDKKSSARFSSIALNSPAYLQQLKQQKLIEEQQEAVATAQAGAGQKVLLPAGEILYAQLITEANSDVQGPVLAEVMSGPFRGSRVLGSFKVQKELLTLNFNNVVIDDVTYPIEAYAIDPETTLPGLATDVDHHYLARVFLPAAASFIEGLSSAISESGTTTITINGETATSAEAAKSNDQEVASGIEELGSELGDLLDKMADEQKVTVVIASGTTMGLLFTQPVIVPEGVNPSK